MIAWYAGVQKGRIEEVFDLVDLTDRARDKFATYSLGMKQRLGVAAALLKDPELLILDEPTNGLDPAGMADMRDLIRRLGSGERTVLLSSHLLGEVEQICDRVGVISPTAGSPPTCRWTPTAWWSTIQGCSIGPCPNPVFEKAY